MSEREQVLMDPTEDHSTVTPMESENMDTAQSSVTIDASDRPAPPFGSAIEIRMKTLDDRETTVQVTPQETISRLVQQGRAQLGITVGYQRVIFQGRILSPEQTIQSASINHGNTVHLVDRAPGGVNDMPTLNNTFPNIGEFVARQMEAMGAPPPMGIHMSLGESPFRNPIRFPAELNNFPVISARRAHDMFHQEISPISSRQPNSRPSVNISRPNPAGNMLPFNNDPQQLSWRFRVIDNLIYRPREHIEMIIKDTITALPFIETSVKNLIEFKWNDDFSEMRIEFPVISPHIPSPALEKLDFLCLWTDFVKRFLDKVEEDDGLLAAVHRVLEMTSRKQMTDGLTQNQREVRMIMLEEIARELELLFTELSHMKDFERERFKRNNSESYRRMKMEEFAQTDRNPRFIMRHAVDVDLTTAMREFRNQQRRMCLLEDLMDDAVDVGAMQYVRETMSNNRDYRYHAISMFFHYMQRVRHQISHMVHLSSELDVSFLTPSHPHRLLPQYATNSLEVPAATAGQLVIKFVTARTVDEPQSVPLNTIIEPPRRCSDVGDRVNGDWPLMSMHPPSVSLEAVMAAPRRVDVRHTPGHGGGFRHGEFFPATLRREETAEITIEGVMEASDVPFAHIFGMGNGGEQGRVRVVTQPRRYMTTGDAPSIPVETQPPPGMQAGPSTAQPQHTVAATIRRPRRTFNVQPDALGPATATLAAFPVNIESTELQRIARNVASRYRVEALQRIATNLTERFHQESWDTRINSMPLCILRECVALALQLLSSAGPTINESRELMLALVREEEVLIRAITECVKSLFGRGEFPTHVSRIIVPRAEVASSRNDYESVDGVEEAQSDELESMIVRMPSDISQPQSGDLRAIRERRANRRQFLESHPRPQASAASTSTAPTGPSFNPDDEAEIRAGRLPLYSRRGRSQRDAAGRPAAGINLRTQRASRTNNPDQAASSSSTSGQGPSTSRSGAGSPTMSLSFTGTSHSFLPQSGTPSSRAVPVAVFSTPQGPVIVHGSGSPIPPTPGAPADFQGTSSRESAASSPVEASPEDSDSPSASARAAAREARAQIDYLATHFTGNLGETREASPFARSEDPRTLITRLHPFAALNPARRTMAAIDPFMSCTSRHCELYRLQNPDAIPESSRFTLLSNQPDPEFSDYMDTFRPTLDRRPTRTPATDEDFNYNVLRNAAGDFGFPDLETFQKFVQTSIRSLLSQCIDTDSLITLNASNISGHSGVSSGDIANMIRRHAGNSTLLSAPRLNTMPFRPNGPGTQPQTTRDLMSQVAEYRRQHALRAYAEHFGAAPDDLGREFLLPGQVSNSFSFIVDYMETAANPRPTGLFDLLISLTISRFSRHEYAQLTRRMMCREILEHHFTEIASQIRADYLDNRTNLDNSELHHIAETLANDESFYEGFMLQNRQMPHSFNISNEEVFVVWAFRQIEVALIKSILTLGSCETLSTENGARYAMDALDTYLYRNLMMFFRIAGRNISRQKNHMRRVGDFVASLRFGANAPTSSVMNAFINEWNAMIDFWYDSYNSPEVHEGPFNNFLVNSRAGTSWNDIPGFGSAAEAANATSPYSTHVSVNQSRKRNHNGCHRPVDGVDVPAVTSPTPAASSTSSSPAASSTSPSPAAPSTSSSSEAPSSSSAAPIRLGGYDLEYADEV